ncbi:glycosyltransferase [Marinivivus vitaminiproducens]|uniref:glycosyltransferase n=1 Tax=Marinivivus vitaminiproducens TaxID=3035935 RepID=UPI00279DA108|nr:glycosyltransferase [Geminicoccaceae bacterium SCSIO 64248]
MYLFFYVLFLAAALALSPDALWSPDSRTYIVLFGLIALWRYGWQAVHLVRACIYRWTRFPHLRARAESLLPPETPPAVFLCMTCHRIPAESVALSVRAAVQDGVDYGGPVTLVVAVAEIADQRLVKAAFASTGAPRRVRLLLVRRRAIGKRDALAASLRAVIRMRPDSDAFVGLMDGDAVLPLGTLKRCLPFFDLLPEVQALTTDEDCASRGGKLWTEWWRLRYAKRQILMCSLGLSRRVLCLTGRFSLYRASAVLAPAFIDRIAGDSIVHWRLGRIPLLTGDDKSAWLSLLERGWPDMLYVPDVTVATIEIPPQRWFLPGSVRLMARWSGNMVRANPPALALGRERLGGFLWWCLIDQRISMWTTLIAPTLTLLLALQGIWLALYAYVLWVAITRLMQALTLLTVRHRISGLTPILLWWTQVAGAWIKVTALFHPDRQAWTRQDIQARPVASSWSGRLRALGSHGAQAIAFGYFAIAIVWLSYRLSIPVPL